MLLKVFLAEDEVNVREGIKNHIKWESEGFEFVGEAGDGELAYPMIKKTKPDILITDIRMPFMDGLELSKLVKQEFPDTHIIVLSGYNEFDYAKEALNIGVTGYLSKPITGQKLLEKVKQVGDLIWEKRRERENAETLHKEGIDHNEIKRKQFFELLTTGNHKMSEIIPAGKDLGIHLSAEVYRIFLLKIFGDEGVKDEYQEELIRTEQELIGLIEKCPDAEHFLMGNEGVSVLLKAETSEQMNTVAKVLLDRLISCIAKQKEIQYFVGMGHDVNRISELYHSFKVARKALAYRYIIPPNQVLDSSRLSEYQISQDIGEDIAQIDFQKIDKSMIENIIRVGSEEDVNDFIEQYFSDIGVKVRNSLMFRQYIAMDIYILCFGFLNEYQLDAQLLKNEFGDLKKIQAYFASAESTKEFMKHIFLKTMQLRNTVSQKKYSGIISKAKKFIQDNFSNQEISLNMTAGDVGVSPSYFSTVFGQETGETFVEYLTNIRMEKAKELLCCTTMRNLEISSKIGYKDAHYFSYIFKKTQGCTPKEFRQRSAVKN
ncbi:MAG: response regulator [Lachnoclostridium sp.]|jgi:two-component system response regulator YesN|nr:response regulator [Lachnoclostridium sp.]